MNENPVPPSLRVLFVRYLVQRGLLPPPDPDDPHGLHAQRLILPFKTDHNELKVLSTIYSILPWLDDNARGRERQPDRRGNGHNDPRREERPDERPDERRDDHPPEPDLILYSISAPGQTAERSGTAQTSSMTGALASNRETREQQRLDPVRVVQTVKAGLESLLGPIESQTIERLLQNVASTLLITVEKNAEGTALIEEKQENGAYGFKLITKRLHQRFSQVATENQGMQPVPVAYDTEFANQPTVDVCLGTAFFIGNNRIVTAGHVLTEILKQGIPPEDVRFVPGYYLDMNGEVPLIPQLYRLPPSFNILALGRNQFEFLPEKSDWAVLPVVPVLPNMHGRLVPAPTAHEKVVLQRGRPECGQEVYCLGYGLGLPLKMSWDGMAYHLPDREFGPWRAKLESFRGNSGSPIFDSYTHQVVGILSGTDVELMEQYQGFAYPVTLLQGSNGAVFTPIDPVLLKRPLPFPGPKRKSHA